MKIAQVTMAVLLMLPLAAQADDGKALFNGKDLDGWRGDPAVWSVEDGAIVGRNTKENPIKHNTFLIYKDDVDNFELTFKYKLVGGNSGVQYRSKVMDEAKFIVGGYQGDFESGKTYSGILYEERGRGILAKRGEKVTIAKDGKKTVESFADTNELQKKIKMEDWNEYKVVANGPVLQHYINGQLMSQTTDHQEGKRADKGVLALQVHAGPPMTLSVKDIVIKPVSGEPAAAKPAGADAPVLTSAPKWIWNGDGSPGAFLRTTFKLDAKPKQARVAGSADNGMTVFINGKSVMSNDNWEALTVADVSGELREGENVIAIKATNEGAIASVALALVADGKQVVVTDGSWVGSDKPVKGWNSAGGDPSGWVKAKVHGTVGAADAVWTRSITVAGYEAALGGKMPEPDKPANTITVADGFKVDLLYSVPRESQGSWVSLCMAPDGRMYTSDQYGALYRLTLDGDNVTVDPIDVKVGGAQGMCWAFDSLYVVSAHGEQGLYRVQDSNGDGNLDKVTKLRDFKGGGEHGPHAVILSPDGKSLYVLGGNHTELPDPETSVVPRVWAEDQLLPRMWDANGHAVGKMAPAGWICETDPEGKSFELVSVGYRNQYDMAFNKQGDLFTYDADMEWDIGLPWYRPTRVCLATSGSEFGWRGGTGKFMPHYPDNLPGVVDIGPGSPTGVAFGYGAKFPAKYQDALFICDWSYGKLYAVHMTPDGAGYTATTEEFVTGSPLPVTDIVVNPKDGAMYFTVGGRRTQSGFYRVTYTGNESTAPSKPAAPTQEAIVRRNLEKFHGKVDAKAVAAAWPYLASPDRYVRFAARTAIEWQPVDTWADRALKEKNPTARIEAMVALARTADKALEPKIVAALAELDWTGLNQTQKLALLRAYALTFARMGEPTDGVRDSAISALSPHYPSASPTVNHDLSALMVYLEAPGATEKTMKLLGTAPTQEEQIHYALVLREADTGWTMPMREQYFGWFKTAQAYKGGASFGKFLNNIKNDAVAKLSEPEKQQLADVIQGKAAPKPIVEPDPDRKFVKAYTIDDVVAIAEGKLTGRDFANGRKMFAVGACYQCHRFDGTGGSIGPDLTGSSGRFGVRDLAEAIIEPSKVISDQYEMTIFTMNNGSVVVGRVANLAGDNLMVATNMFDPGNFTGVNRKQLKSAEPSPVSPMPPGLIFTMTEDEVRDLMAYLLSGGDPDNAMFK